MAADELPPDPLGEVARTDDDTEDQARARYSVADLYEADRDDETTPSDFEIPAYDISEREP